MKKFSVKVFWTHWKLSSQLHSCAERGDTKRLKNTNKTENFLIMRGVLRKDLEETGLLHKESVFLKKYILLNLPGSYGQFFKY